MQDALIASDIISWDVLMGRAVSAELFMMKESINATIKLFLQSGDILETLLFPTQVKDLAIVSHFNE